MVRIAVAGLCLLAAVSMPAAAQQSCWLDAKGSQFTGQRDTLYFIQRTFDSLRVCMSSDMLNAADAIPSDWVGRAPAVLLETRIGHNVRAMRLAGAITTYTVNGEARSVDTRSTEWMRAVLDVADASWRLDRLRGRESALRGELDALRRKSDAGQEEIRLSPGDIVAKRKEYDDLKDTWQSLGADLERARMEQRRLNSDIRTEQSEISSLQSQLSTATASERTRINNDIRRSQMEIRRLESERRRYDSDAQSIQNRLATMDLPRRFERLERELGIRAERRSAATDSASRASAIEGQLMALDVQRNAAEMESRLVAAVSRLRSVLAR
jgi:chromosome segregation ATPase